MDPLLACHAVSNLVAALAELDRPNTDYFEERGRADWVRESNSRPLKPGSST